LALLTREFNGWLKKEGWKTQTAWSKSPRIYWKPPDDSIRRGLVGRICAIECAGTPFIESLAPRFQKLTLAFCLDIERAEEQWHSHWALVNQSVRELKSELEIVRASI